MGFPLGYSELPKLLLPLLFLLGHLRLLTTWVLRLLGLGGLLDPDAQWPETNHQHFPHQHYHQFDSHYELSMEHFDKHLPVLRFEELVRADGGSHRLPENCAVCLQEFEGPAEVRRPSGCRHVFHRGCLDRWAEHGPRTCPLCRAPLVPEEPREKSGQWVSAPVPGATSDDYYFPSSPLPPPALLLFPTS